MRCIPVRIFLLGILLCECMLFSACVSRKPPPRSKSVSRQDDKKWVHDVEDGIAPAEEWVGKGRLPTGLALSWPTEEPFITSFFGWRKRGRRSERLHDGVDLKAHRNTKIYAAADGEVIYASRKIRSYGKMIVIDHGDSWSSVYAHLNDYKVKVGAEVKRGDLIGLSGQTGRVSGPHLHFELRLGSDPLDPLLFLPKVASEKP
jgi:murein DD-endopeptidase MepM/ murein hydrolase activator NlpD